MNRTLFYNRIEINFKDHANLTWKCTTDQSIVQEEFFRIILSSLILKRVNSGHLSLVLESDL